MANEKKTLREQILDELGRKVLFDLKAHSQPNVDLLALYLDHTRAEETANALRQFQNALRAPSIASISGRTAQ